MDAQILPAFVKMARRTGAALMGSRVFSLLFLCLLLQMGSAVGQTRAALALDASPPSTNAVPPPPPEEDPYDDAQFIRTTMPTTIEAGTTATVTIGMRNTGSTTWSPGGANPYRLGSANPHNNYVWGVVRANIGAVYVFGDTATFTLKITAPSVPGTYSFDWQMLREDLHWFGNIMSRTVTVTAPKPVYNAQLTSASIPTAMTAGGTYSVALTFQNTGNVTWNRSETYRIGTSSPYDNVIFGRNRVDLSVASVAPGQSATFNFQVQAPASAGSYQFDWGMLWENNFRFGQTTARTVMVNPAPPKPSFKSVTHLPTPIAGRQFTTTWETANATSLTRVCTSAGTGFKVNESLAVTGSRTTTALAAWVDYPSTCVWTATGAGGTTTYTDVLKTLADTPATPKPTISVKRTPLPVQGQSFTTTWTTTNATTLSRVCTASGSGYKVNESLAVNGSRSEVAQPGWVGNPSSCTWTANGAGGTTTFVEQVITDPGNGIVTYLHTDALGSPVARTNAGGELINRTRYEPYGFVAGGVAPTIGFTGHVNDVGTELTYMQQRYYDPVAGRFLSIDPVVTDANSGGSFNRYWYGNNNPYKYVDPDGRLPILVVVGIGAGIDLAAQVFIQKQPLNDLDYKGALISGVGAVISGGIGGRLAQHAIKGTITTTQAVGGSMVGGAMTGAGGAALTDIVNGEGVNGPKMVTGAIGGAIGAGIGGQVDNAAARILNKMGSSGGVNSHIAESTRSAVSFGKGNSVRLGESTGQVVGKVASDTGTAFAQKKVERDAEL